MNIHHVWKSCLPFRVPVTKQLLFNSYHSNRPLWAWGSSRWDSGSPPSVWSQDACIEGVGKQVISFPASLPTSSSPLPPFLPPSLPPSLASLPTSPPSLPHAMFRSVCRQHATVPFLWPPCLSFDCAVVKVVIGDHGLDSISCVKVCLQFVHLAHRLLCSGLRKCLCEGM